MSDLVEFLLERIAEDEELARGASQGDWFVDDHVAGDGLVVMSTLRVCHLPEADGEHPADADHIARHDPARVLAECEAKRRIVALDNDDIRDPDYWHAIEEVHRLLALPYADHPDYDPAWA